jgi:SAM-dependent methyltransferase
VKILDVGCGAGKIADAIGIDIRPAKGVDVVHDLNKTPWPLKESDFDLVYCRDVIEHLDDVVKTMGEIHRVAKAGAKLIIYTPHFAHPNSFRDPTHKWHFTRDSFDYFLEKFQYPIYTDFKFKMLKKEFRFRHKWGISAFLARLDPWRYEKYYAHRFPPYGLYFELEVVKS